MSFSIQKIIIILILVISNTFCSNINSKQHISNDYNYTYNITDIKIAKTSKKSWEKNKDYGYFSAIVYRDGLEHGYEVVRVLINKVYTDKDGISDMVTVKDIQIDTPGIRGTINDIHLNIINNKLSLGVDIRTRVDDNLIMKQILMIDLNGNVRNLVPLASEVKIDEAFYEKH